MTPDSESCPWWLKLPSRRPLRAALAPRASPLASSYSQAKMDGRPRTSEQPPAGSFGGDAEVNDSFLRSYLPVLRSVVKGKRGSHSSCVAKDFHSSRAEGLRETQTVRSTSAKNTDFRLVGSGEQLQPARSKKPELEPEPGPARSPGAAAGATASGDCV